MMTIRSSRKIGPKILKIFSHYRHYPTHIYKIIFSPTKNCYQTPPPNWKLVLWQPWAFICFIFWETCITNNCLSLFSTLLNNFIFWFTWFHINITVISIFTRYQFYACLMEMSLLAWILDDKKIWQIIFLNILITFGPTLYL